VYNGFMKEEYLEISTKGGHVPGCIQCSFDEMKLRKGRRFKEDYYFKVKNRQNIFIDIDEIATFREWPYV